MYRGGLESHKISTCLLLATNQSDIRNVKGSYRAYYAFYRMIYMLISLKEAYCSFIFLKQMPHFLLLIPFDRTNATFIAIDNA
jgi:hypothetical protein